jgi:hypothetical protein
LPILIYFWEKKQSKWFFWQTFFYVDEYGNISDTDKIVFGGDLATRKGDMLPMNYLP